MYATGNSDAMQCHTSKGGRSREAIVKFGISQMAKHIIAGSNKQDKKKIIILDFIARHELKLSKTNNKHYNGCSKPGNLVLINSKMILQYMHVY